MEQKSISSDLIRGHIDTIILHTLIDGDKYAQQISDFIDEKSGKLYQINQATLYSSLKRLENLKNVKSYWYDSDGGRRKYFSLTDSGRTSVKQNLSSWSYSRAIINKLMDCEPEPIYKTQYIEKIIEKPVTDNNIALPFETPQKLSVVQEPKVVENKQAEIKSNNKAESETEINFRNILSGLIKTASAQHVQNEDIMTVDAIDYITKDEKIEKFNDKIVANDLESQKTFIAGKVDLSELSLKAIKEGYKLRVSSKDSFINVGTLLINKLNLISSTIIFLITTALLFILKASFFETFKINTLQTLLLTLCFISFPLINAILYALKPNKTTNKAVGVDTIIISLIVVFNLTLVTFAGNLLFNVDFTNFNIIFVSLILPFILYALIIVYFIIKFLLTKTKIVKIATKKK